TDNGSVKVSPTRASKGSTVTVTVKPDEGYELDELTVTDKNGDSVKLTDKGDGKYTFQMPASKVTVEAVFTAVEPEPEGLPF
ncbi:S-layer homology domain-containing protein, partial [Flavonifractor plautii]|nr:S-layer homology domain-containing protein [Flavonifractor plautii]